MDKQIAVAGLIAIILIALIIFFLKLSIDSMYSFDSRFVTKWNNNDSSIWEFKSDGILIIHTHNCQDMHSTWKTKDNQLYMLNTNFTYEFSYGDYVVTFYNRALCNDLIRYNLTWAYFGVY
jgi:uncharacterized membrane protein YraQ (UPF0718 family)